MVYQIRGQNGFLQNKNNRKNEWIIKYKTKYGFFVIPFGFANVFNIFQYYINWVLRDFFDEICLVYVDDISIHTDGSRTEHQEQFFLKRLRKTGLKVNVNKREFETKTTKYLSFIFEKK